MADTIPECPLEFLIKRYEYSLECAADNRGKKVFMLGDYFDWEEHVYDEVDKYDPKDIALTKDPAKKERLMKRLSEFLSSIQHVFISENAYCSLEWMLEYLNELSIDVDGDIEDFDDDGYNLWNAIMNRETTQPIDYQELIASEVEFGSECFEEGRYQDAADAVIASLFALKWGALDDGWGDNDNRDEAQHILCYFGALWEDVMDSDELKDLQSKCEKQWILPSGYVRESAKRFNLDIPDVIRGLISKWTAELAFDEHTRAVLYGVIKEMHEGLEDTVYHEGIPFGGVPSEISDLGHEKIDIMDIDTYIKTKGLTISSNSKNGVRPREDRFEGGQPAKRRKT